MSDLGWLIADNPWLWTSLAGFGLGALVFVFAVRLTDIAPLVVMATVPIQRELLIGTHGHYLTYTQICVAGFFAGALFRFLTGRLRLRFDFLSLMFLAIACFYGLSIVAGGNIGSWVGENYRWLVPILFFVVARSYFDHHTLRRLRWFIGAMIGVGVGWSAIQIGTDAGPSSFSRNGWTRTFGGFGEPNPFAAFLVAVTLVAIPIAFAGWIAPRRTLKAIASTVIALIGTGAIFTTQSRGGMLGFAAGLALLTVLFGLSAGSRSKRLTLGALAIGATLLVLTAAIAAPWSRHGQDVTVSNWADRERTAHWRAAWAMVTAHPWLGVGAGSFTDSYRVFTTEWRFRISRGHAHNAYLQVAAEVGIPALCAYLAFLSLMVAKLIDCFNKKRDTWLPAGALAVTIAMSVHQMFDYLNVLSLGIIYSGIWAAALAIAQKDLKTGEYHVAN